MNAPDFHRLAAVHVGDGFEVIPAIGKRPPMTNWPDLATDDMVEVAKMARQYPRANVAGATGRKRIVLDFDKKNGGLESFATIERDRGALLTADSWRVFTGSGGAV